MAACDPMSPIGYIESVFSYKNGTPRQPSLCPYARGKMTISKSLFTNPDHSLENLDEFSHVWVIFVFHKNNNKFTKAKVKPPRLNGRRVGVFSTRSPYRPNPIGLTLAKLDKVDGSTIYLSGIDLLDGTPVLDIKPYIPSYDVPNSEPTGSDLPNNDLISSDINAENNDLILSNNEKSCDHTNLALEENMCNDDMLECTEKCLSRSESKHGEPSGQQAAMRSVSQSSNGIAKENNEVPGYDNKMSMPGDIDNGLINETDTGTLNSDPATGPTKTADWLQSPPVNVLSVRFTNFALEQLKQFSASSPNSGFCLNYLKSGDEVQKAINDILCQDPRSVYRRKHCVDSLYYFVVDTVHVTAWFDKHVAEVIRLQPVTDADHLHGNNCKTNYKT